MTTEEKADKALIKYQLAFEMQIREDAMDTFNHCKPYYNFDGTWMEMMLPTLDRDLNHRDYRIVKSKITALSSFFEGCRGEQRFEGLRKNAEAFEKEAARLREILKTIPSK
tara:strand:+ start:120 stop:452 length:333 start_codon:yes stop_codon:yes gene_type:complete